MDISFDGCVVWLILLQILNGSFGETGNVCGPDLQCTCARVSELEQMDCSFCRVKIKEVCDIIGADNCTSVKVLKAGNNNIGHFNATDIKGCRGLLKLDLQNNELSNIVEGSFVQFTELIELDLSSNELTVYEGSFDSKVLPQNIKVLYLNGNFKDSETTNSFANYSFPNLSNLRSLEKLYIDGFSASFGEEYRNMNMHTLTMSGLLENTYCNVSEVHNSTFSNLVTIKNLDISMCSVDNIHAGAFKNLASLERLDLSYNLRLGFTSLSNVSFGLQFTNISFLNYTKVYTTFGLGTKVLKRDLCYLRNTSLKELAMDSNRIQMIDTDATLLLPKGFKKLHIGDNKFTFGPYLLQMGCMNDIVEFYGSYQNKAHDPKHYLFEPPDRNDKNRALYSDCPFMTETYLNDTAAGKENCDYIGKSRRLQFNPSIPPNLKVVKFSSCDITYSLDVPIAIRPVNNSVECFDFSGNVLHSWEAAIGPFPKLKYLDLSKNYCSNIGPNFFANMSSLENLQIHTNFLGSVLSDANNGQIFTTLESVHTLNLSANRITNVHSKTFEPLKNLRTLDLSSNNIEMFTIDDLKPFTNILNVYLAFNFISTLPKQLRNQLLENAARLNTSFSIDLRNNTISYNCGNEEFLDWLIEHEKHMVEINQYTFLKSDGTILSYVSVKKDLSNLKRSCRNYTLLIVLCSIGVSVFLSIVIGGVIYKNRWKLRYLIYMSKARYFGYRRLDDESVLENFKNDAFISYAEEDIRFILDGVIPNLEERGLSLCIHQRDFIPGNAISDNIIDAIQSSKKTIIMLSKTFLTKKWCMYEFNMARMESLYSRDDKGCLVIVMLEDVPTRDMPLEMLEWIEKNSYIEYTTDNDGAILFWDILRDAIAT